MDKLRRNLFTIFLFVCIAMMFEPNANASSAALLEATAEGKLKSLMDCIKSNDNDISLCLDSFKDYLRTAIKLVNTSPDEPNYKSRLNKMVDYLRKSADIFYQKAQDTRSLEYYDKASRCAKLLVKLSDKYENYGKMISEFENIKRSNDNTVLLELLYTKTTKEQYPNASFQSNFHSLVSKVNKSYEYLEIGFQKKIIEFGNQLISQHIDHMRSIVGALQSYTVPTFGEILNEFLVYKTAIMIPGVDPKQDESLSLRKQFGTSLVLCLDQLKIIEGKASKSFLEGNSKIDEETDELTHITNISLASLEQVKLTGDLFLDVPNIPDAFCNDVQELTHFLQLTTEAKNESINKEYVKAVNLLDKALTLRSVGKKLAEKAQLNQIEDIQAAIDKAIKNAKDMAGQKKFIEALKELEIVSSSVSLNKKQEGDITPLKHTIQTNGQRYILELAKRLQNSGDHMEALRTIDMAKAIGMNDDLTDLFLKLKKDFDYSKIQTIEDSEYFINCSSPELLNFMAFPKSAGSNTYCSGTIEFANQIDNNGYFGYLFGNIETPVYASIINKTLKGATLLNKTMYCVFRISGIKELVNRLTNAPLNIPQLEVIFIQ